MRTYLTMVSLTLSVSSARSRAGARTDPQGVMPINDQKLILNLSDLAAENIEVVPADSLDSATYGHGMPRLAASCPCSTVSCGCASVPNE